MDLEGHSLAPDIARWPRPDSVEARINSVRRSIEQRTDANAGHLERIIEELCHLPHQKYPVHEIY